MTVLDVLCFAAHPDDSELCCGGTMAALSKAGRKVGIVDLTRGEKGSRGTPETRKEEAANASKIIGLEDRSNLGLPDTQLENKTAYQRKIISKIRAHRPHICFVGAPSDRHPDHGNGTELTLDALFYSGLIKIETTDEQGNNQRALAAFTYFPLYAGSTVRAGCYRRYFRNIWVKARSCPGF